MSTLVKNTTDNVLLCASGGGRASPSRNGWAAYWGSTGGSNGGIPGVPPGYKMAQDPMTGQLFLVPGEAAFHINICPIMHHRHLSHNALQVPVP